MAKRPVRDLTVGAVFALALIIFALAVMVVGGESGLWFKRDHFYIQFPDATGLMIGAPVRMAGVQVGTVSAVELPTDPSQTGIRVQIGVDSAYTPRVRQDSRVAMRILQFLTNEKFVELLPGTLEQPMLDPESTIPLLVEVGVVERGEAIADNLGQITASLKNILGPLERGDGLLGQMLHDPEFGRQGVDALGKTLGNLERISEDLANGRGAAGRMLQDEALAARLDRLAEAIDGFTELVGLMTAPDGFFREMVSDGGGARTAIADLQESAASLRRLTAGLEDQEGLLGRLLQDPEYSAKLAGDLETTLSNVAEITDKINRGEGTLGALVNERTLYDGAEDVVAGVDDSKFARWLTRHYRKKGIKAQEQEAERAAKAAEGD
jgi:phospholipid/cholesterol/gamma-HCH transport system substrate-binding protein